MNLPPHGTTTRYDNHRCRCQPCSSAKCAYAKKRRYLQTTGRWNPWTDPARARAVLVRYKALGVGASRVADVAGIARETAWRIVSGDHPKITHETERKILAAKVTPLPGAKVSAVGSCRRVHALMCMGYTQPVIREQAGVSRGAMSRLGAGRPLTVAWVAEAIMRAYDELSMIPAPVSQSSKVARTHAKKMGYLPPLAWAVEVARQISTWDDAELAEAYRAYAKKGDRSPLMVAGSSEYRRRQRSQNTVHDIAA